MTQRHILEERISQPLWYVVDSRNDEHALGSCVIETQNSLSAFRTQCEGEFWIAFKVNHKLHTELLPVHQIPS
jgi:hypothetical protein